MDVGVEFYLVCALSVLVTGISKSGFAGGLGVLAVPAMSLFVAPQTAAAIMLPILCTIDIANIWKYRRTWVRRYVALLLPGALVGIGIGTATFRWLDADLLKIGIGVLSVWFVVDYARNARAAQVAATAPSATATGNAAAFGFGALSGLTSFVAHAGGPPIKAFLLSRNLEKSTFVGTNSVFFFLINQIKLVPYFFLGQFSSENLLMSLMLAPFVPIGIIVGFRLHAIVSQNTFTKVAYGLLLVAGVKLLWDGVAAIS